MIHVVIFRNLNATRHMHQPRFHGINFPLIHSHRRPIGVRESGAYNRFHSTATQNYSWLGLNECILVERVRCCYRTSVMYFGGMLTAHPEHTQRRIVCAPQTLNYGSAHIHAHTHERTLLYELS